MMPENPQGRGREVDGHGGSRVEGEEREKNVQIDVSRARSGWFADKCS